MLPSHGESQRTEQLLVGWLHDLSRSYHKGQKTPQPMSGLSNFQLQLFLCSFMQGLWRLILNDTHPRPGCSAKRCSEGRGQFRARPYHPFRAWPYHSFQFPGHWGFGTIHSWVNSPHATLCKEGVGSDGECGQGEGGGKTSDSFSPHVALGTTNHRKTLTS